jgi:hypothetical protein
MSLYKITMEELGITVKDGIYEALNTETDLKKCKLNFKKRITYISETHGVLNGFTSKSWSLYRQDNTDEFLKCICGQEVKHSYIFYCHDEPDIHMRIGSTCVFKYNTHIINELKLTADHMFDTDKFDRTCSVCSDKKLVKNEFCGGSKCNKEERITIEMYKISDKIDELSEEKITFGKFKGTMIRNIDPKYLQWLKEQEGNSKGMKHIQKVMLELDKYNKQWNDLDDELFAYRERDAI